MSEIGGTVTAPTTLSGFGGRIRRLCAIAGRALASAALSLATRIEGMRSRRRLQALDDRALRDLGLDRDKVDRDSTVSFWRLR